MMTEDSIVVFFTSDKDLKIDALLQFITCIYAT